MKIIETVVMGIPHTPINIFVLSSYKIVCQGQTVKIVLKQDRLKEKQRIGPLVLNNKFLFNVWQVHKVRVWFDILFVLLCR